MNRQIGLYWAALVLAFLFLGMMAGGSRAAPPAPERSAYPPAPPRSATAFSPTELLTGLLTPTATPIACGTNGPYVFTTGTASIISGTVDTGNHCDNCATLLTLPFTVAFYGQNYTAANILSNGNLQFVGANVASPSGCLPAATMNQLVAPYWDDLRTDTGAGCAGYPGGQCGIFTSVTGSAPNRIFNIEWRAVFAANPASAVNFEIRFYESAPDGHIDFVYGAGAGNGSATIGLQKDTGSLVNSFVCPNNLTTALGLITWRQPACLSPTPAATATVTGTPPACGSSDYTITVASSTVVPGGTPVPGICGTCEVPLYIPFPFDLYPSSAAQPAAPRRACSAGGGGTVGCALLQMPDLLAARAASSTLDNVCLPAAGIVDTIFAHWDELAYNCAGCGVYTSTLGTAPNRTFHVRWAAVYTGTVTAVAFELRLYENPGAGFRSRFDLIYGEVPNGGSGATVGVQQDCSGGHYTSYECNTPATLYNGLQLIFTLPACGTPTPTPTGTPLTATPTRIPTLCPPPPSPSPTSTVCAITFTDVDPTNPFYVFIRCLACRGLVSGYGDGTYRPNLVVTRGQLAKILAGTAGYSDVIPSTQQSFEDVPLTNPFWIFVERLLLRNAFSGYPCGGTGEPCVPPGNRPYFRPNTNATRGQISKITSVAAFIQDVIPTTQQSFEDVPSSNPFWLWIEQLAGRGIISGYNCGGVGEPCIPPGNRPYFRWGANTTRGQLTKIAAQTFYPNCVTPARR